MINADEHKKLFERITALERESVNRFDVEKNFFLIDSDNLSDVQTRFYGYSIQSDGIYEDDNLTPEAVKNLDGRGCYVYIDARDGQITIKQDLNGSWGIYLFRHGDYFALSNSFFRLLDHVKFRRPLTVNRDYCHYLLLNDVCSHAYSETAVNEIQLVDRSAILHIDTTKKSLETELTNYREYSVSLDSQAGMVAFDRWVELWGKIFRGLARHTNFVQADLSGGFDSRISFALLLNSKINLNNVRVYSIKGTVHTFGEDYDIAAQIADHFKFKLNEPFPERQIFNCSLTDIFNLDLYSNRTVSSLLRLWGQKGVDKVYRLGGMGGETLRDYWIAPPKEFTKNELRKAAPFSQNLSRELCRSIERILDSGFRSVQNKYHISDSDSRYIPQLLYQESRCRNHFGKESLCSYFVNNVRLVPALDPEVRTLKLVTSECSDAQLLMTLLFVRYEPDLLKFPFQGKRSLVPETVAYAQKLNERFPLAKKNVDCNAPDNFRLQPRDVRVEKILAAGGNNPDIPDELSETCLKAVFESTKTYGLFTSCFDEELYRHAATYYDTHVFGRARPMYSICGVAKILEDVQISQRHYPKYQDMKRFLEQDFWLIHNNAAQIINKFGRYFTARIQFQLWQKTESGAVKIISISDDAAKVSSPEWYTKNGIGYIIHSCAGKLKVVAKAFVPGQIRLNLLGLDVRNPDDNTERIPYWIDYTKLTVNGAVIFDELTPAWHDKSYRHRIDVAADEEFTIEVEWLPHRSDT